MHVVFDPEDVDMIIVILNRILKAVNFLFLSLCSCELKRQPCLRVWFINRKVGANLPSNAMDDDDGYPGGHYDEQR